MAPVSLLISRADGGCIGENTQVSLQHIESVRIEHDWLFAHGQKLMDEPGCFLAPADSRSAHHRVAPVKRLAQFGFHFSEAVPCGKHRLRQRSLKDFPVNRWGQHFDHSRTRPERRTGAKKCRAGHIFRSRYDKQLTESAFVAGCAPHRKNQFQILTLHETHRTDIGSHAVMV